MGALSISIGSFSPLRSRGALRSLFRTGDEGSAGWGLPGSTIYGNFLKWEESKCVVARLVFCPLFMLAPDVCKRSTPKWKLVVRVRACEIRGFCTSEDSVAECGAAWRVQHTGVLRG